MWPSTFASAWTSPGPGSNSAEPWEDRIIASTASPIVIRKVIASLLDVRIVVGCWMLAMDQRRVMKIRGSIWILIFNHGLKFKRYHSMAWFPSWLEVHLGRKRHGADDITSGERLNLILWNHSSEFRGSAEYQRRRGWGAGWGRWRKKWIVNITGIGWKMGYNPWYNCIIR